MTNQMKRLFDNAALGNISVVKELLANNVNVDKCNTEEVTALHVASANGQEKVVKILIMNGASLDKNTLNRWTPLLQAARYGHSEVVATLLQHQVNVNAKTCLGINALLLASCDGNKETVRQLINSSIDTSRFYNNEPDDSSSCDLTPLMIACFYGNEGMASYLLKQMVGEVNERSPSLGISPLMLAALGGHETLVKYLLEKQANPNLTDINGRTALDFGVSHDNICSILSTVTTQKSKSIIHEVKKDILESAKKGNFQQMREILDSDLIQRDATDSQTGATPLMFACILGRGDMVEELVERGCDIDKVDFSSGWTALMQAVFYRKNSIAKYLIKAGADVQVAAKNGCTALDIITLLDEVDSDLYRMLASATLSSKNNHSKKRFSKETNSNLSTRTKAWWLKITERIKKLQTTSLNKKDDEQKDFYKNININNLLLIKKVQSPINIFCSDLENTVSDYFQNNSSFKTTPYRLPPFSSHYKENIIKMPKPTKQKSFLTNYLSQSKRNSLISSRLEEIKSNNFNNTQIIQSYMLQSSAYSSNENPTKKISNPSSSSSSSSSSSGEFNELRKSQPNKPIFYHQPQIFSHLSNSPPPTSISHNIFTHTFFKNRSQSSVSSSTNTLTAPSDNLGPDMKHAYSESSTLNGEENQTSIKHQSPVLNHLTLPQKLINPTINLTSVLKQLSLDHYQKLFDEQEIDLETFLVLSDSNLQELGILNMESRKLIMNAINHLKNK